MALSAAIPSTNMEAAFGRLHNSGAGAFGARRTVMAFIIVGGMTADTAIQPTPSPIAGLIFQYSKSGVLIWDGVGC